MPRFNKLLLSLFSSFGSGVWTKGLPHAKHILYPGLYAQLLNFPISMLLAFSLEVPCVFWVGKWQLWSSLLSIN